jgi:hypothetical protein
MTMPRVCTVCTHPERAAIDAAIVSGEPLRRIAARAAISEASVRRHKAKCIPASLVKASAVAEVIRADDLLGKVKDLEVEARRIGRKAEEDGDLRCAIAAVRQVADILELLARLLGTLPSKNGQDRPGATDPPAGSIVIYIPDNGREPVSS